MNKRYKVKKFKATKGRKGKYYKITDSKTKKVIGTYKEKKGKKTNWYLQQALKRKKKEKSQLHRGTPRTKEQRKQAKKKVIRKRRVFKEKRLKEVQQSKERIKLSSSFSETLKRGSTRTIANIEQIKENTRKIYEELLGPLVLDKEMLDIVIENKNKLKHRFSYITQIYGTKQNEGGTHLIAEIKDVNITTSMTSTSIAQATSYFALIIIGIGMMLIILEIDSKRREK